MAGELTLDGQPDVADAGAFVSRVVRLDPAAVIRMRPAGARLVALWAVLPIEVLVSRVVGGSVDGDLTVAADPLLTELTRTVWSDTGAGDVALPPRDDLAWRATLPGTAWTELDTVPAAVVRQLVDAGEQAFAGVPAGAVRQSAAESLLGHESLRVSGAGREVVVPLRMLLALARMGFLGGGPVRVGAAGGWLRVAADYGAAHRRLVTTALL